jgi:hypothetical protein
VLWVFFFQVVWLLLPLVGPQFWCPHYMPGIPTPRLWWWVKPATPIQLCPHKIEKNKAGDVSKFETTLSSWFTIYMVWLSVWHMGYLPQFWEKTTYKSERKWFQQNNHQWGATMIHTVWQGHPPSGGQRKSQKSTNMRQVTSDKDPKKHHCNGLQPSAHGKCRKWWFIVDLQIKTGDFS